MSIFYTTMEIIDTFLSVFTHDNFIKGLIIAIPHYVIMTLIIVYVIFARISTLYYWLVGFLFIVLIINIIYRGCILIKCERRYFETKQWFGGYELLRILNIPLSDQHVINYYYLWVFLIGSIILSKLLFHHFSSFSL